jgi:hypothetical protein
VPLHGSRNHPRTPSKTNSSRQGTVHPRCVLFCGVR